MLQLPEDKLKDIVKLAIRDKQAAIDVLLNMQDSCKTDNCKGMLMALRGLNSQHYQTNFEEHISQILNSLPLEDIDLAYLNTWRIYLALMREERNVQTKDNEPDKDKSS